MSEEAPLVPIVVHLIWRRSYYAYWLPNTFYAKTQNPFRLAQFLDLRAPGWRYVIALFDRYRLEALAVPAALCVLAPRPLARVRGGPLVLLAVVVAFPLYAGGDWMSEGRFLAPAIPI